MGKKRMIEEYLAYVFQRIGMNPTDDISKLVNRLMVSWDTSREEVERFLPGPGKE